MKLRKRFAAMGAAMVIAVSMMGVSASAYWSEHFYYTTMKINANFENKTTYREIKTRTTNLTGSTVLVGSRASYLNSSETSVSTVYTTAVKATGSYHQVRNQGSTSSTLVSSYHYSEIYNGTSPMTGLAKAENIKHTFTYTGNDGFNWN
ncbi:MAG: hypothetical protein IJ779_02940 [Ruminococcus sp.]|nr:hypothetical protein [Ruminococcus sp.]